MCFALFVHDTIFPHIMNIVRTHQLDAAAFFIMLVFVWLLLEDDNYMRVLFISLESLQTSTLAG